MDPDHLGYLIDRYLSALVLYARQWCRAPEDVVQESFIKLARQAEPPIHPVAWLYRAVRNRAISESRAERRPQAHEGKAAAQASLWFTPSEDPSAEDAQKAHMLQVRRDVLRWGVDMLPDSKLAKSGPSQDVAAREITHWLNL